MLELKISLEDLAEYKQAEAKQHEIVKTNHFVACNDHASYTQAKAHRTALVKARTDLKKGEKAINSKLNDFKSQVKAKTEELISITEPHEIKQQEEVKAYEAAKEAEREAKRKAELERIQKHKDAIAAFRAKFSASVKAATLNTIDGVIQDLHETTLDVEEFAEEFRTVKIELKESAKERNADLQEQEEIRKQAEAERKRLDEERKALEAQRKKQEADERKIAEQRAQEEKERKEREAIEAERLRKEQERLAAERAKFEAEKAEAEQKKRDEEAARMQEVIQKRKAEVLTIGFVKDGDYFVFGNLQIDNLVLESEDWSEQFETLKADYIAEFERLEKLKPELEKLRELISSIVIPEMPKFDERLPQIAAENFLHELSNLKINWLKKAADMK